MREEYANGDLILPSFLFIQYWTIELHHSNIYFPCFVPVKELQRGCTRDVQSSWRLRSNFYVAIICRRESKSFYCYPGGFVYSFLFQVGYLATKAGNLFLFGDEGLKLEFEMIILYGWCHSVNIGHYWSLSTETQLRRLCEWRNKSLRVKKIWVDYLLVSYYSKCIK